MSWKWLASVWTALLCFTMAAVSHAQAQAGNMEAEPRELHPPEMVPLGAPFPVDTVAAVEDYDFEAAHRGLDSGISAYPQELGLRYLRQQLASSEDALAYLSSPLASPAAGASVADRYEATLNGVMRLGMQIRLFRGDKGESAAAFIARLEAEGEALETTLRGLEAETQARAWIVFARCLVRSFLHRLGPEEQAELWKESADAGDWTRYLRLVAIFFQLPPENERLPWLQDALPDENSPQALLRGMVQTISLAEQTRTLRRARAIEVYEEAEPHFAAGPWEDDLQLAMANQQAYAYDNPPREVALSRYKRLVEGRLRNTTYPAMEEYGALLRRLDRFELALQTYEAFHSRFPLPFYRFDRAVGRACYKLERYPEAVAAFKRSSEGPRGNGEDYLFLAESMRFLPEMAQSTGGKRGVREDALKLADFSAAARAEEVRVWGWSTGNPAPVVELVVVLAQLKALSRHALLYPKTFMSLGLKLFFELVVLGLALLIFVSFPRLSRRYWRLALGGALLGLALVIPAALGPLPDPLASGGTLGWLVQASVRLFFVWAGTLVLSPVVGMQGLGLWRGLGRVRRRKQAGGYLQVILPVALVTLCLGAMEIVGRRYGFVPTPYLERFPTLLAGAELGTVLGDVSPVSRTMLLIFHAFHTELLARGFLLALLALLLRGLPWRNGVVLVVGAILWTLFTLGVMEPTGIQVAVTLIQGGLLGWLRLRRGCDAAVLAHVLACGWW
jgi:tetratricopeptide (TPR) repeat protein